MSAASFAALTAARWIHFASVMLLFGASLFPFYALPAKNWSALPAQVARAQAQLLRAASAIALASGIAWAAASLASMTGDIASVFQPDALLAFLFETGFRKVWLLRLVLMMALIPAVLIWGTSLSRRAGATVFIALIAGMLLVSQAWIGHPAASTGGARVLVISAYGLHVLGAGAWLGGLPPLWLLLQAARREQADVRVCAFALQRFSTMGILAIAAILAGGLINAWARWDSFASLLASAWGEVLIAKVLLFVGLLVLAAANRFVLMPRLPADDHVLPRLARNVVMEQACGLAILAAAAMLGILAPPS